MCTDQGWVLHVLQALFSSNRFLNQLRNFVRAHDLDGVKKSLTSDLYHANFTQQYTTGLVIWVCVMSCHVLSCPVMSSVRFVAIAFLAHSLECCPQAHNPLSIRASNRDLSEWLQSVQSSIADDAAAADAGRSRDGAAAVDLKSNPLSDVFTLRSCTVCAYVDVR